MQQTSVVVVEDHKLLREMWICLLTGNKDIKVVGQSGNVEEALDIIESSLPDIVLLDINLSQSSGFDAVPLVRAFSPTTKIIILTIFNQPEYCKKMFTLGASGYITKNSSEREIFLAIGEVMNGRKYVCNELKERLTNESLTNELTSANMLTFREKEIIGFVRDGLTSKEIGTKLDRSFKTVETHRSNILKKLGLKNTASLIQFMHLNTFS